MTQSRWDRAIFVPKSPNGVVSGFWNVRFSAVPCKSPQSTHRRHHGQRRATLREIEEEAEAGQVPHKGAGRFRPPHSAGHNRGASARQAEEQVSQRMSSEAALGAGGTT